MSQNYLTAAEIDENKQIIRDSTIDLLLRDWEHHSARIADPWVWGDEIEYQLITLDAKEQRAYLALQQNEVLEKNSEHAASNGGIDFQPEYTKYQVESTPQAPYASAKDLLRVEESMKTRRRDLKRRLGSTGDPFTLSMFPLLGSSEDFTKPAYPITSRNATSSSIPDEIISAKTRYQVLETNLRERAGKPAEIRLPVFKDIETPSPYVDPAVAKSRGKWSGDDNIHMDGLIFGPGVCGLQVTLQMRDLEEARNLHDQFCAIAPIMMALTASTPIYKGRLADVDARWHALEASLEDRKPHEHECFPTRWSTSPMYIGSKTTSEARTSDYSPVPDVVQRLAAGGMDDTMARYFGYLLLRDPILLTGHDISSTMNENQTDLDTRLGTSSWPHIRLKLPDKSDQGWRIEFRTMEVQPTDFGNAAGAIFLALLRHALTLFDCDFCMSIDKLKENMIRAQARDAVNTQKFWWRTRDGTETELTCQEIVNGGSKEDEHKLLPLANIAEQYASGADLTPPERETIQKYLTCIRNRASGKEHTPATWMRNFVARHEDYTKDSVVNTKICYDMLKEIKGMNHP